MSMLATGFGRRAEELSNTNEGGDKGRGKAEGGGGAGVKHEPRVPFCRAGADVANMWLPAWAPENQRVETAKRVIVFAGKGIDYYSRSSGDRLSYLSDMWALHITNTGFVWSRVTPQEKVQPSPRWQTGDSVAFDRSLVIFGGDDQTTDQVGGLGDLWVFTPREPLLPAASLSSSPSAPDSSLEQSEWKSFERGGKHPGERREPSLTMIDSTLVLQGGKVVDGESNEVCDSRLFLLDLSDPEGLWVEGASLPGGCGVGQTMDTVRLVKGDDSQARAVVFGGCQWDSDGLFRCSNDLHAYDLRVDEWRLMKPKSDADAEACASGSADINNTAASTVGASGERSVGVAKSVCPGTSEPRPLGRYAHASAYIESSLDSVHALFIFGGRENEDELVPLGDLWMFDFNKMRWKEITIRSKRVPVNRFGHSLTVWQGGAGDGRASLVVFGGETITKTGQAAYMNDVWLYTPHTGAWREVSRSDCQEGASGIVRGGNWSAVFALGTMLALVLIVECLLHHTCPHYDPPPLRLRWQRRRRRPGEEISARSSRCAGADGGVSREVLEGGVRRGKSAPSLSQSQSLLSGGGKQSYQAFQDSKEAFGGEDLG